MNRSLKQYLKKPSSNNKKIAPFKPNQYSPTLSKTNWQNQDPIEKQNPTERKNQLKEPRSKWKTESNRKKSQKL